MKESDHTARPWGVETGEPPLGRWGPSLLGSLVRPPSLTLAVGRQLSVHMGSWRKKAFNTSTHRPEHCMQAPAPIPRVLAQLRPAQSLPIPALHTPSQMLP